MRSLTDAKNAVLVKKSNSRKSFHKYFVADYNTSLNTSYQRSSKFLASSSTSKASYNLQSSVLPRETINRKSPMNQQSKTNISSHYIDLDASGSSCRSNDSSKFDGGLSSNICRTIDVAISSPSTTEVLPQNASFDSCSDVEMSDVSTLPSLELLSNMQLDKETNDEQSCYIVVDTNILMSELKFVNELKDVPFEGYGLPHIFIPWIVIQELDRLKAKCHRRKYRVVEAVKYIYTMLSSKHPRFHGQTAKMAASCYKSYDECNDDVILGCCLQLQEKMDKEKVILLTNDRNLCNKSLISGVRAYTMETLLEKLESHLSILIKEQVVQSNAEMETETGSTVSISEYESTSAISESESTSVVSDRDSTVGKMKDDSTVCKAVDSIMSEVRLLLKAFLEPYLKEAVMEAFGDLGHRFLPKEPVSLIDILAYYKKYWHSVFGCVLPRHIQDELQKLSDEFSISNGYSCNADQALSTLKSVEVVNIELLKVSTKCEKYLDASLSRLQFLIQQCRTFRKESRLPQELDDKSRNREAVLRVFHHIWDLINHLCGMILDFTGKPHSFVYNKPDTIPSKLEFNLLISNLYPGMHKIKSSFSKVLNSSPECDEAEVSALYNHLVQFVPSLRIQAAQPPLEKFNVLNLKQFCNNSENKNVLQNGFRQLENMFSKLDECIHDSIWLP